MFKYVTDNRKMNRAGEDGGAAGDDIIISGEGNPDRKPVNDPAPLPADTTPTVVPPVDTTRDLVAIDDKTDKLLKDAVASKYEDLSAVRFNTSGDLVNVEGKVLIEKAKLDEDVTAIKAEHTTKAEAYLKTLKIVEVEGVERKVSEDGSVKDDDGNVVLTREQLLDNVMQGDEYLSDDDDDISIFAQAEALTGLTPVDETGNPIEFEESPQGLAQRDLHIAKQEGTRIAQEYITNFFKAEPELEDAYYYKKAKGTLEGFGQLTNHEGIVIDKDDEQQQVNLIVEGEMVRGFTKEQAIKRAELFKKSDMAYETAVESLAFLVNNDVAAKAKLKSDFEAAQLAAEEAQQEYWTNVATKLNTGKIADYNIPENIRVAKADGTIIYKTRRDFYNYISAPVQGNLTQAQLDAQGESLDNKLLNDYLRFVGYNMDYLIDQKVKKNMISNLKQRFNKDAIPPRRIVIGASAGKTDNDRIVM